MIVILGGGPAGRIASIRLATAGKKVTLVEHGDRGIGGQCLHAGCMPVCALNDIARMIDTSRTFHDLGLIDTVPTITFRRYTPRDEGDPGEDAVHPRPRDPARRRGYHLREDRQADRDGHVFIGDEKVEADDVIIATGSRPNIPTPEGSDLAGIYNPHSVWSMKDLPKRLTIIGGGVMAAEFAYIFHTFGSKVTVISRSGFLKDLDPHLRALARKELEGCRDPGRYRPLFVHR